MTTQPLDPATQQQVTTWLTGPYDAESKATIQHLIDSGNTAELTDAFYRSLEFGTGGLCEAVTTTPP